MDLEEFINHLRTVIAEYGTQKKFAAAFGISEAVLSDVLNGRREPSTIILDAVGFERIVTYHPKGGGNE